MDELQNLEFAVKKENQIELKEQKAYAAPKLTKLGSLTQIVNLNSGVGGDGAPTIGFNAT